LTPSQDCSKISLIKPLNMQGNLPLKTPLYPKVRKRAVFGLPLKEKYTRYNKET
jgi:hypothetical protein